MAAATNSMEFTTAKKRRDPIPFTVDGREMVFNPPKKAMMVLPIMNGEDGDETAIAKATFDWLGKGLTEEDNEWFKSRMLDDDDDFDVDDLAQLVNDLSEKTTGRPTT